jgi:ligand-binding SRPBCC domain-containing protein
MSKKIFVKRSLIAAPVEQVFAWHEQPQAFERLCPPWQHIEILERVGGIADGARTTICIHAGRMKITWKLEHTCYIENKQFCDFQIDGPLRSWYHKHLFEPAADGSSFMEDRIEYELPFGMFGMLAGPIVESELKRLFDYRHEVLKKEFAGT